MHNDTRITTAAKRHALRATRLLAVVACACWAIGLATAGSAAAAGTAEVKLEGTGTVSSNPSGIDCTDIGGTTTGECTTTDFPFFGHIELTATPGPGSQFEGWRGNEFSGECESGATNPCSYTEGFLTYEVTAIFGSVGPQQPLEVKRTGAGVGEVTSSPKGIECGAKCKAEFSEGSTVVLTASPNEHSTFARWTGCSTVNSEDKCEVTMSAAKTVEAEFDAIPQQTLEVIKTGSGSGEVTSSPPGIECGGTCTSHFNEGSTVIVTATPASAMPGARYTFGGWKGCSNVTAGDKCEVTMSEAKTVEAEFDVIPQQTLKVQKTGSGSGEVTSSPSGISCGGTCEAEFGEASTVTLTATPTSESVFVGWSGGGCTGTAPCEVTLIAATTVTATFEPVPPPTASTGEATEIAQTTAALSGIVNGQGFDTHYLFDYGETASFGSQAPGNGVGEDAGGVATNTAETINVSGLTPNTTYHYKIVAYNIPCSFFCPRSGPNTVEGAERTFTTLPLAPAVTTDVPVSIGPTTATVAGEVVPQCVGGRYPPTTYRFEYGTTTAYGAGSEEASVKASSCATGGEAVTASVSGLLPDTTYHYRLDATNSGGTTVGSDRTFTTNVAGEPSSGLLPPGFSLTGTAPAGPTAVTFPNLAGFTPMPPPPAKTTPTPKPLTNAQKLAKALKACKKDKSKSKRAACDKQARKKYGTKVKKKAKK
jgi:hypothetical protein